MQKIGSVEPIFCLCTVFHFVEHIPDIDPVSGCRIVDHDVRDRTDQFSVLKDRTAAHALYDTAGFFQKHGIRYPDDEILGFCIGIVVDLFDSDGIRSPFLAGKRAVDRCRTGLYFPAFRHFYGRVVGHGLIRIDTEYADLRIGKQFSAVIADKIAA